MSLYASVGLISSSGRLLNVVAVLNGPSLGHRVREPKGTVTPTPELGATYYDRLSTIAAKRKGSDSVPAETPATELDRVPENARCVRCQGPIGGEPTTGRCPGCLLLVRYSLDPEAYAEMQRAASQVKPKPKTNPPEAQLPTAETKPRRGFWKRLFGDDS